MPFYNCTYLDPEMVQLYPAMLLPSLKTTTTWITWDILARLEGLELEHVGAQLELRYQRWRSSRSRWSFNWGFQVRADLTGVWGDDPIDVVVIVAIEDTAHL